MEAIRGNIEAAYEAINSGDVDRLRDFFAPDMLWHQPGTDPFSGEYLGLEQMLAVVKRERAASEGRFSWNVTDILVGDAHGFKLLGFE